VLLVGSTYALPARAQSAEAQDLFDQGRRALAAKDYATACTKLEASERLERAVGTLISLAECEEAQGHLAGARSYWQEAANWADATHDRLDRGPIARARFDAIDKRVPRLTLALGAGAPQDTRAQRDGVDLGSAAFGSGLAVDPGRHVIVVSASGRLDATFEVDLKEGEQRTLEVMPGAPQAATHAPIRESTAAGAPAMPLPDSTTAPPPTGSSRRTWAYITGGVGLAGIGVGATFGALAAAAWSQAKSDCGPGCPAGATARNERSTALTDATVSTVALTAGGVALAAGAFLFFTSPSSSNPRAGLRVAPWIASHGGGAAVAGAWP
jgi:hypothetical protein